MSKHSHISAIFDNAFQSRAGSPQMYICQSLSFTNISGGAAPILASVIGVSPKTWRISASADARSLIYIPG